MIRKVAFILIIGILFSVMFFLHNRQQQEIVTEKPATFQLSDADYAQLQNGDVILRYGYGMISEAIAKHTKGKFPVSHCGILQQESDTTWSVIHTVSNSLVEVDGMQKDALEKFVREGHVGSIIVLRYISEDTLAGGKIVAKANRFLQQKIPFDNSFDFNDDSKFFCTEMLWHVFNDTLQKDILEMEDGQKYNCLTFDAFFNENNFKYIINYNDSTIIENGD